MSARIRSKVKTGCQTCKSRKVKCDEAWPVCRRCQAADRTCEGYGIWGGGNKAEKEQDKTSTTIQSRINSPHLISTSLTKSVSVVRLRSDESDCYDWFLSRSMPKLSGAFKFQWLATKLIQTSVTEPSIRHALLALASAHRAEVQQADEALATANHNDPQALFTLKQYSLAITNLQPCFQIKSRASIHILLITCVLFISTEFLQGQYTKGLLHIKHGLTLIQESWNEIKGQDPFSKYIDGWLLISFMRFLIQAKLFGQLLDHPSDGFITPYLKSDFQGFTSSHHARRALESTMLRAFDLRNQSQQLADFMTDTDAIYLAKEQQKARADLEIWLRAYQATINDSRQLTDFIERVAYQLLHLFYHVANVLTETCLDTNDETRFDLYEPAFLDIIVRGINLYKMVLLAHEHNISDQNDNQSPSKISDQSISDVGCIAPLYFTAIHCRNHRLRRQAISLLSLTAHKEGIWDGSISLAIASRVVELEEGYYYSDIANFNPFDTPTETDLAEPTLPPQFRISQLAIVLPHDRGGKLLLTGNRRRSGGLTEVIQEEYDLVSHSWRPSAI